MCRSFVWTYMAVLDKDRDMLAGFLFISISASYEETVQSNNPHHLGVHLQWCHICDKFLYLDAPKFFIKPKNELYENFQIYGTSAWVQCMQVFYRSSWQHILDTYECKRVHYTAVSLRQCSSLSANKSPDLLLASIYYMAVLRGI